MPRAKPAPAPLTRAAVDAAAVDGLEAIDRLKSHLRDVQAAYESVVAEHSGDALYDRKLSAIEAEAHAREERLRAEHAAAVDKLKSSYEARIAVLDQEVKALKDHHRDEVGHLNVQLDLLAGEHDFLKEEVRKNRQYQQDLLLRVVARNPAPGAETVRASDGEVF